MSYRYVLVLLAVLLSAAILTAPGLTGFSEASRSTAVRGSASHVKVIRAPQKLVLRSASVLVEDQQTGECLVQKQAEAVLPIASITKLMTAMVVLDAKLNLQELLTITAEDVDTLRNSHSRLSINAHLTRGDALLLALMASENRAAHALGRTYPGGLAAFVAAMNVKARSLGLAATHFEEPTGISSGNVSSARDLARMVNAAYSYRLIQEYTTCKEVTIRSGRRTLKFHNSNRLIQNPRWHIGLSKTGYIDEAGRCLVMQSQVANRPLLIVLLDAQGKLTRYGDANRIKKWMEGLQPVRHKLGIKGPDIRPPV
jgi:D-alanyl-D-alanine endopeptidase (penicillin-binding protein 7)